VRTCERTYTEDEIIKNEIRIHDLKFDDGKFPDKETIKSFLNIIDDVFKSDQKSDEEKCIAVHCIAGLGR
jgi:protein tyrosine phosphatase type IVA